MSGPAGGQVEDDSGDTNSVRERLITVAAQHFANCGLQGASQRAIQREVGVNPGAANYYFGTKEALFLAVIEDSLDRMLQARKENLALIEPGLSPPQRLRCLLRAYLGPMLIKANTKRGHSYLRILVARLALADVTVDRIDELVKETRELYAEQLSRLFPAVSRLRIYEIFRMCVSITATMPIQTNPDELSDNKISAMIDDATEITALLFERFCDPSHA